MSQYQLQIVPSELVRSNSPGFFDYRGIIHVQSSLSNGRGNLAEIVTSAQNSKVDFLILTDLNVFPRPTDWERYYGHLLLLIGGKYSYSDSRLLVVDSLERIESDSLAQLQAQMTDRLYNKSPNKDLFISLAHPKKPRFEWKGEVPEGVDAIEIINLRLVWQRAWVKSPVSFLWSVLLYPFHSELALVRLFSHPSDEVDLWGAISEKRHVVALAGTEATSQMQLGDSRHLSFPSYETLFSLVSNHVLLTSELTGQLESDRRKIISALSRGQFYMSLDVLGDPKGFVTYMRDKQQQYAMGADIKLSQSLELHIKLSQKPASNFEVIVFRNREKFLISNSVETRVPINSPGAYRVVVRVIPTLPLPDGRKWFPWIYSNFFFVSDPSSKGSDKGFRK